MTIRFFFSTNDFFCNNFFLWIRFSLANYRYISFLNSGLFNLIKQYFRCPQIDLEDKTILDSKKIKFIETPNVSSSYALIRCADDISECNQPLGMYTNEKKSTCVGYHILSETNVFFLFCAWTQNSLSPSVWHRWVPLAAVKLCKKKTKCAAYYYGEKDKKKL